MTSLSLIIYILVFKSHLYLILENASSESKFAWQFLISVAKMVWYITWKETELVSKFNDYLLLRFSRPRDYKTWAHSPTRNKVHWLAACGHVSASSQSLRFILSPSMNSSFRTSRPDSPLSVVGLVPDKSGKLSGLICSKRPWTVSVFNLPKFWEPVYNWQLYLLFCRKLKLCQVFI